MALLRKHNLIKHIKGKGIEIGALNNPLNVDHEKAWVTYLDMLDKEGLAKQNPEIPASEIKAPDIVADAENLEILGDASEDFIIASHLLEHLPNPIKTLKEFYRILKTGGILYMNIPDKRYTFDKERPVTSLSHLLQDYKNEATPETSTPHYQEWLTMVELKKKDPVVTTLEELTGEQYRIHFHVWLPDSMPELLNYLKNDLGIYFYLEDYYYRKGEGGTIYILKKVTGTFPDIGIPLKEKYSNIRIALAKCRSITSRFSSSLKRYVNFPS